MNWRAPVLSATLVLLLGVHSAAACDGRLTVWDLEIGTPASDLPDSFIDYACGTNGGPPARVLSAFDKFALCDVDDQGLHEIYFRYDDEAEFVARALEQDRRVVACQGTRVLDIPVTVSALFDQSGILRGVRLVTDARGQLPAERDDHWALGTMLRRQFPGDWKCEATPLPAGGTAAARFVPNEQCALTVEQRRYTMRQAYFHRIGQSFEDEFGYLHPDLFVSETYFQVIEAGSPL